MWKVCLYCENIDLFTFHNTCYSELHLLFTSRCDRIFFPRIFSPLGENIVSYFLRGSHQHFSMSHHEYGDVWQAIRPMACEEVMRLNESLDFSIFVGSSGVFHMIYSPNTIYCIVNIAEMFQCSILLQHLGELIPLYFYECLFSFPATFHPASLAALSR